MCKPKFEGGMGFKELSLFNDALLAKQTWRLLHNTNSLFYKVFKSKFFPNCSIMEAKEGYEGLYAWRSILKGREVIRQGGEWAMENQLSFGGINGCLLCKAQASKVPSQLNYKMSL